MSKTSGKRRGGIGKQTADHVELVANNHTSAEVFQADRVRNRDRSFSKESTKIFSRTLKKDVLKNEQPCPTCLKNPESNTTKLPLWHGPASSGQHSHSVRLGPDKSSKKASNYSSGAACWPTQKSTFKASPRSFLKVSCVPHCVIFPRTIAQLQRRVHVCDFTQCIPQHNREKRATPLRPKQDDRDGPERLRHTSFDLHSSLRSKVPAQLSWDFLW